MMTFLTSILPIFLILLVSFIFWSASKVATKNMILFSGKIKDFVLVVYVALLLVGTIVSFGFAMKTESEGERDRVTDEEIAGVIETGRNFSHHVETGTLSDAEGVFVNKEWHFPYEGSRLLITGKSLDGGDEWVVVKRKNENDNVQQVEIVEYMTKSFIDEYDYSHYLKPPNIKVNDQGIQINHSERTELKLARFTKEFTINQFTKKQFANDDERFFGGSNHVRGQNVLYVRVPESIEVVQGNGVYLQFVD